MVLESQRREARPTAILLGLAIALLLPTAACGTIGLKKLDVALSPIVSLSRASELGGVRPGTYVEVDVQTPREEIVACRLGERPSAWTSSLVVDAPTVIVASRTPIAPAGSHVVGQLCDAGSPLTCEIPERRMKVGLEKNARLPGRPTRLLVNGAVPSDMMGEAVVALGLAAACLLTFLVAASSLLRAAREPGRIALVRSLSLSRSPEEIRAALRAEASPLRRIAEDTPERICFLIGTPVARVHVMGIHTTETLPLRVDLEFEPAAPYRGTIATLTVRELLPAPRHFAEGFSGSMTLAVERAAAWVLHFADDMGARSPAS